MGGHASKSINSLWCFTAVAGKYSQRSIALAHVQNRRFVWFLSILLSKRKVSVMHWKQPCKTSIN